MSTLHVENLKGLSSGGNANKIIVPSGQTIDASAGTLVPSASQVVQHLFTQPTTATTFNSGTYTDGSGFTLSITPKYSNSKILIRIFSKTRQNNTISGQSGNSAQDHRILRDSTQIYYARWQNYFNSSWATTDHYPLFITQYIDTPNTTSAITYKLQGRLYNGSQVEWRIGDYNGGNYHSLMELLEIKQ